MNSLIQCPACQADVSALAPACPRCGHPVAAQTIEATGKRWKLQRLLACAGIGIGICLMAEYWDAGVIVVLIATAGYIHARIATWWHHE